MFRSISRCAVAVAFVLAIILSTTPAQALPRDFGSSLGTSNASWLDTALAWLGGLLGGGEAELQGVETGSSLVVGVPGETDRMMTGSCLDPYGNPCGDNG